MSVQRRSGFSGPEPLSFVEIAHWSRLMRLDIEPWEVTAIVMLDLEFRAAQAKARRRPDTASETKE